MVVGARVWVCLINVFYLSLTGWLLATIVIILTEEFSILDYNVIIAVAGVVFGYNWKDTVQVHLHFTHFICGGVLSVEMRS